MNMINVDEVSNIDSLMNKECETNESKDIYMEDELTISKSINMNEEDIVVDENIHVDIIKKDIDIVKNHLPYVGQAFESAK